MIDTHTHIDSEDFDIDLEETISRAKEAGVEKVFLPAIDYASSVKISGICASHQGVCYPMYADDSLPQGTERDGEDSAPI